MFKETIKIKNSSQTDFFFWHSDHIVNVKTYETKHTPLTDPTGSF